MAEQYAPRLALIAILAVLCRGILGGGDFTGTIKTAAIAAAVFFALGLLVGEIAGRLVEEHVRGMSNPESEARTTRDAGRPA